MPGQTAWKHQPQPKFVPPTFVFLSGNPDSPVAEELAAVLPDGYSHPWCYIIPLSNNLGARNRTCTYWKTIPRAKIFLYKEATAFHLDTLQRQAVPPQGNYRISPFDLSTYLTSQKEEGPPISAPGFPRIPLSRNTE